jgi:hypothetical protein
MHKSEWIVAAAAILTLVLPLTSARATIDFDSGMYYFDYDIEVPALVVTPDTPGSVSIVINKEAYNGPEGVIGARFGLAGLPSGWFLLFTADPSLIVLGNPNSGQVQVQFPSCQNLQPDQNIVIMRLIVFATNVVNHQQMHIVNGGESDPYGLPVFLTCDATPVEHWTNGGVLFLNPYTVGVEETSWSTIKSLYRD